MAKSKTRGPAKNSYDATHMGLEPDLSKRKEGDTLSIALAYNWYNYFFDSDIAKEYLLAYMAKQKYSKEDIGAIKNVPSKELPNTLGWNARILTLGGTLPADYHSRMQEKLNTALTAGYYTYGNPFPDLDKENKEKPVEKVSIQDRVREKITATIGDIEGELDNFYRDPEYTFSIYDFLTKKGLKPVIASGIADFYIPRFNELVDVLSDGPEDLKEGYRNSDKDFIIAELQFIQAIIEDAQRFASNVKKTRAPRVKKPKSADKVVAKLKYKQSDDKYKITSVRPIDLVGADQLWVFNSKTRFLGVYKSAGPAGLSVKGSKIINFDEKESYLKKLRKPEETLKLLMDAGKVQLRKLMDNINSKTKTTNGRINTDTVLVRVVK